MFNNSWMSSIIAKFTPNKICIMVAERTLFYMTDLDLDFDRQGHVLLLLNVAFTLNRSFPVPWYIFGVHLPILVTLSERWVNVWRYDPQRMAVAEFYCVETWNFVRNSPGVRHRQSASHPRRPPRPPPPGYATGPWTAVRSNFVGISRFRDFGRQQRQLLCVYYRILIS